MSEHPNIAWEWPNRLDRWVERHFCDDRCDRHREWFTRLSNVNDVDKCRHGRTYVVVRYRHIPDSNGGTYFIQKKRLRPWRVGYWRARRMLPKEDA